MYREKLSISAAKKADLLSFCKSGTIPQEYEQYFSSLTTTTTARDKLPAPSISESGESDWEAKSRTGKGTNQKSLIALENAMSYKLND